VSHLTKSFLRAGENDTRMRSLLAEHISRNHDNAKALSQASELFLPAAIMILSWNPSKKRTGITGITCLSNYQANRIIQS
jgi:hypothetical protein